VSRGGGPPDSLGAGGHGGPDNPGNPGGNPGDVGDVGDVGDRRPGEEAVDDLFRSRRDASIRLAVFLVGDVAAAEEIVQDAFLEVTRRWHQLDNPAGYLRTAVVNRCSNHRRRLATLRRRPVPPSPCGRAR
jgi:hypothetical protein